MSDGHNEDSDISEALGQIHKEVNEQFKELRREPWMPQLEKNGDSMSTDDWIYYVSGKIEGLEKAAYIIDQATDDEN